MLPQRPAWALALLALGTVLVLATLPGYAYAQSTGKISGQIIEAGTGTPLIGVSVYLDGTQRGTTTDADGRYVLLSVPPGEYTVVMSFIGFATMRVEDVLVHSGRTTSIDGELAEETLEGIEVIVTAERPIVVRDRTTSVSFVEAETIDRLPVQEVGDVIRFQPGVVAGSNGGFHFRGGRQRETAYLVDGIPVEDVFSQSGGSSVDVEVQSVQEVQVFTGTFDAEFGGAQSGVVNLTTREPGSVWSGHLRSLAGGYFAGTDETFIGGDRFDPLDTKDVSVTLSGPISGRSVGLFMTGRFVEETGYLRGIRQFLPEDGFTIGTYRRWYRDLYNPDDTRLVGLDSARTPTGELILGRDGEPLTFASGDGEVVDMQTSRTITLNPKFVIRPFGTTTLTLASIFTDSESQGYSDSRRYAPDGRVTSFSRSLLGIASLKQALGSTKVLSLRASYKKGEYDAYAFESLDDPGIVVLGSSDETTGFSLGTTDNWASRSEESQFVGAADLTWQIDQSNEFKAGVQFRASRLIIEDLDRDLVLADNPDSLFQNLDYPDAAQFATFDDYLDEVRSRLPILAPELAQYAVNDRFDERPIEFAVFAQDKLEFESRLVVKAGLRFEYFDVGATRTER